MNEWGLVTFSRHKRQLLYLLKAGEIHIVIKTCRIHLEVLNGSLEKHGSNGSNSYGLIIIDILKLTEEVTTSGMSKSNRKTLFSINN